MFPPVAVPNPPQNAFGAVAQLGERYNGIVEVVGSIPSGSTNLEEPGVHSPGFSFLAAP